MDDFQHRALFRLSKEEFDKIHDFILGDELLGRSVYATKKLAFSVRDKLYICLYHLASGVGLREVAKTFGISPSYAVYTMAGIELVLCCSLYRSIYIFCDSIAAAINKNMGKEYLENLRPATEALGRYLTRTSYKCSTLTTAVVACWDCCVSSAASGSRDPLPEAATWSDLWASASLTA